MVLRAALPTFPQMSKFSVPGCLWLSMSPWHMGWKQVRGDLGVDHRFWWVIRERHFTWLAPALFRTPELGPILCSLTLPVQTTLIMPLTPPLITPPFFLPWVSPFEASSASPFFSLDNPSINTAYLSLLRHWTACSVTPRILPWFGRLRALQKLCDRAPGGSVD